jgi:hypothetical protein
MSATNSPYNNASVPYDQAPLLLDLETRLSQGQSERILIHSFDETMAKIVVHGVEEPHYPLRQLRLNQFAVFRVHP